MRGEQQSVVREAQNRVLESGRWISASVSDSFSPSASPACVLRDGPSPLSSPSRPHSKLHTHAFPPRSFVMSGAAREETHPNIG